MVHIFDPSSLCSPRYCVKSGARLRGKIQKTSEPAFADATAWQAADYADVTDWRAVGAAT